jgi:hypothetical protein
MKFKLWALFAWVILNHLNAQKFKDVTTFQCEGYSLEKIGYPSKLVSDGKGNLYFVEYWVQGKGGRRVTGRYLQCLNSKMEEVWFKPIFAENQNESYEFIDLFMLNKTLAVIGSIPLNKKERKTVVQFFSLNGKDLTPQLSLSNFEVFGVKYNDFEQFIVPSADSMSILWLGYNPQTSANKRRVFVSVFGNDGKKLWSNELNLPYTDKKYIIKQTLVDKKGNPYFLMVYEKYLNIIEEDKKNLPVIIKYDYKQKKFYEFPITFENAAVPEINMFINSENNLLLVGAIADGNTGIQNGDKIYEKPLNWSKFFYKRINVWEGMKVDQENFVDIPENMKKKYAQNPSNFKESLLLEKNGKLLWLIEEAYQQNKDGGKLFYRYDVAVLCVDMKEGKILWSSIIEKKQRDFNNDHLFSYIWHFSGNRLHIFYMSEKGAGGKAINSGIDLDTGEVLSQEVIKNESSNYYFFPARSTSVDEKTLILLGVGKINANQYMLLRVIYF